MKSVIIFLLIIILVNFAPHIAHAQQLPQNSLIISEFFPNPDGSDAGKEWVELFNNSEEIQTYSGFKLVSVSTSGSQRVINLPEFTVQPHSYFLIVEDNLITDFPDKLSVGNGNLNLYNDGLFLRILDANNNILDEANYSTTASGRSLERNGIIQSEGCNIFQLNSSSHTMANENSNYNSVCWGEETEEELPEVSGTVLFSFDNTNFSETVEAYTNDLIYINYQIESQIEVVSSTYKLDDGTLINSPFEFPEYLQRSVIVDLTLSDGRTVTLQSSPITINQEIIEPVIQPDTLLISEIYPTPNSGEEEWVEIYNYGDLEINLKDFYFKERSSSGISETKNFLPEYILKSNEHFVILDSLLKISLNNSGDKIYLFNSNDEILSEVEYPSVGKGLSFSRNFETNYLDSFEISKTATPNSLNQIVKDLPKQEIVSKQTSSRKPITTKPKVASTTVAVPKKQILGITKVEYKLPSLEINNHIEPEENFQTIELSVIPFQILVLVLIFGIISYKNKLHLKIFAAYRNLISKIENFENVAKQNSEYIRTASKYDIFG